MISLLSFIELLTAAASLHSRKKLRYADFTKPATFHIARERGFFSCNSIAASKGVKLWFCLNCGHLNAFPICGSSLLKRGKIKRA
jgi:hypothetical protein